MWARITRYRSPSLFLSISHYLSQSRYISAIRNVGGLSARDTTRESIAWFQTGEGWRINASPFRDISPLFAAIRVHL